MGSIRCSLGTLPKRFPGGPERCQGIGSVVAQRAIVAPYPTDSDVLLLPQLIQALPEVEVLRSFVIGEGQCPARVSPAGSRMYRRDVLKGRKRRSFERFSFLLLLEVKRCRPRWLRRI